MVDFDKLREEDREIRARIAKLRKKNQHLELEDWLLTKWALRDAIREIATLEAERDEARRKYHELLRLIAHGSRCSIGSIDSHYRPTIDKAWVDAELAKLQRSSQSKQGPASDGGAS